MRYFTADLHLGHVNIIKYCNRPFGDVAQMDNDIVTRFNAVLRADDELVVVGDLALGKLEESLATASLINGNKILIPGNHDSCWVKHKRHAAARGLYEAAGFTVIDHFDPISVGQRHCLVNHFPYTQTPEADERFADYRPTDRGEWLLHGHIHDHWRQHGRMINVGLDAWGGNLVSEAEITALIADGPRDRDVIAWQ